MDLSRQAPRAAEIHTKYLLTGERTCIDCHKGIAHELPDMTGVEPGWTVDEDLQGTAHPGPRGAEEVQSHLMQAAPG